MAQSFFTDDMKRLLFAVSIWVLSSQAWGQHWKELPLPPSGADTTSAFLPYFLNTNVGFTFDDGIELDYDPVRLTGTSSPTLSLTTNGGASWSPLNFFDTTGTLITQLCFVSPTHGYAATVPINDTGLKGGGIYETFDQGSHWKKITKSGLSFSGVYATKNAVFASEIDTGNYFKAPVIYSYDDGATWNTLANVEGLSLDSQSHFQLIYGNRDSLVATVYFASGDSSGGYEDIYLVFSTDLGRTWHSSALGQRYLPGSYYSAYGQSMIALHIVPHSCHIIRQFLGKMDANNDTYSFLEAGPPYSTWDTVLLHLETGAWIAGNDCAMYVSYCGQDYSHGPIERSLDGGMTWQNIGKNYTDGTSPDVWEIDDFDWQNLSAVGYGAVVYAGALTYSFVANSWIPHFWKTTDGGDGTLSAAALAPQMALAHAPFPSGNDTFFVSCANEAQMVVTNFNIGCSWATFDSVTIDGLSPDEYSLTSTHYCGCMHVPDTSFITLQPKLAGLRKVTVHFHYTDDEYNQIDTTLPVVLDVKSSGLAVPLTLGFGSGTMNASPGDTISIPVYLSGTASLGATTITMPFGIDTNILWPVGFQPALQGLAVGSSYYSRGTETVLLQTDSSFSLTGQTLLGYLRCIVYLTDTLSTAITLPTANLNSTLLPCTALSLTTDSIAVNIVGCGTKILQQFLLGKPPVFAIRSIVPNPATNEITIIGGSGLFTIFDPLGRSYSVPQNGNELDISSLPSGFYFVSDGISGAKFVKE